MALQYLNITGNSATSIVSKRLIRPDGDYAKTYNYDAQKISVISICNKHDTDAVILDLYLYDETLGTYYVLSNTKIPVGATLILEGSEVRFDNKNYALKILLNASDSAVDVIIK